MILDEDRVDYSLRRLVGLQSCDESIRKNYIIALDPTEYK